MAQWWQLTRGFWRRLDGVCPGCGGEEPEAFTCPDCRYGVEDKSQWWPRFRERVRKEAHSERAD